MKSKKFKQLSFEERVSIATLKRAGWSMRKIARHLGRSPNTIARELREKIVRSSYIPKKAQHKTYWRRYIAKQGCLKLGLNGGLARRVVMYLEHKWSPERIAGYLKRQDILVSKKAIYKFVYSRSLERYLFWHRYHKRGGPKRRKHRSITDGRKYIEERPKVKGSGNFEADFIVSSSNTSSLLVVVDRFTTETLIQHIPNRKHATVLRAFQQCLGNRLVKTITLDNDIAFDCWRTIERNLKCSVYFCHPYHSWEKGLVENTNRWIRCFVPKRTDLRTISEKDLDEIQTFLNTVPRQCLGFRTADELRLFEQECPN